MNTHQKKKFIFLQIFLSFALFPSVQSMQRFEKGEERDQQKKEMKHAIAETNQYVKQIAEIQSAEQLKQEEFRENYSNPYPAIVEINECVKDMASIQLMENMKQNGFREDYYNRHDGFKSWFSLKKGALAAISSLLGYQVAQFWGNNDLALVKENLSQMNQNLDQMNHMGKNFFHTFNHSNGSYSEQQSCMAVEQVFDNPSVRFFASQWDGSVIQNSKEAAKFLKELEKTGESMSAENAVEFSKVIRQGYRQIHQLRKSVLENSEKEFYHKILDGIQNVLTKKGFRDFADDLESEKYSLNDEKICKKTDAMPEFKLEMSRLQNHLTQHQRSIDDSFAGQQKILEDLQISLKEMQWVSPIVENQSKPEPSSEITITPLALKPVLKELAENPSVMKSISSSAQKLLRELGSLRGTTTKIDSFNHIFASSGIFGPLEADFPLKSDALSNRCTLLAALKQSKATNADWTSMLNYFCGHTPGTGTIVNPALSIIQLGRNPEATTSSLLDILYACRDLEKVWQLGQAGGAFDASGNLITDTIKNGICSYNPPAPQSFGSGGNFLYNPVLKKLMSEKSNVLGSFQGDGEKEFLMKDLKEQFAMPDQVHHLFKVANRALDGKHFASDQEKEHALIVAKKIAKDRVAGFKFSKQDIPTSWKVSFSDIQKWVDSELKSKNEDSMALLSYGKMIGDPKKYYPSLPSKDLDSLEDHRNQLAELE